RSERGAQVHTRHRGRHGARQRRDGGRRAAGAVWRLQGEQFQLEGAGQGCDRVLYSDQDCHDRSGWRQLIMKLIRFRYEDEKPRLGVVERGQVYDLAGQLPYATLGDLLAAEGRLSERIDELKSAVSGATAAFELTDLL